MGAATLDLTTLDLGRNNDLTLVLQDPARPDTYLGEIYITATLYPKSQEDKEQVPMFDQLHNFCFYCVFLGSTSKKIVERKTLTKG